MKNKFPLVNQLNLESMKVVEQHQDQTRDKNASFRVDFCEGSRGKDDNNNNNMTNILDKRNMPTLYGSFDHDRSNTLSKLSAELSTYNGYGAYRRHSMYNAPVSVADIIGSFGWFQLFVLLFSGLREATVGYDAVVMSIMLQPEEHFVCADSLPESSSYHLGARSEKNSTLQCYINQNGRPLLSAETGDPLKCESWTFTKQNFGASLLVDWQLVCHHHWLGAFIESAYFLGLVAGNLTWGFSADRIGRRKAYLISHTIALVFGCLSIGAPNIWLLSFCRFWTAFGSIGYNIIYSIQVELIGTKHRAFSTILNHLGWGTGVILVPVVDHLFDTHTPILSVAPMITLVMFPIAFWLPESSRWLMSQGRYEEGNRELIRAAKFNGRRIDEELDKKLTQLGQKIQYDKMVQETFERQRELEAARTGIPLPTSSVKSVRRLIFEDPELLRDTIVLSYTAFVGHLFYYLLTINFGYVKNLSTDANFIISGAGEWVSVVIGALLLKFCSRKTCMSIFLTLMTCSFVFQSVVESDYFPWLDNPTSITLNNGIGTLSSLLLIFIALIVNQEIFPTVIRQTGSSLVNTVGELGSTLAPLVIQLGLMLGGWQADALYATFCLIGILCVQLITKTDDIELPDT